MEVQTMSIPLTESMGEAIVKGQLASWLDDTDVSALLNIDEVTSLDLQSVITKTPEYFCMPDSPFSSPYSSPELPEMDNSFSMAPPLFDEQLLEVDAMIFEGSFTVNPEMLPELEKILSSVDSSIISPPASPSSPSSDFVPDTTRASKKRKGSDGKECGDDSIFLPRNQLLTMTSTEIEDYVMKIKAQRTLTVSEEKELKRQRRLIKNREYASQSRSRKKQYVDELEKTIENIRAENSSLKQQVTTLSDENKTLKRQMLAIATTIKKKSAPASISSSGTPNTFTKLTSVGAGSNNVKTVATCLLAIMFMVFTFEVLWEKQPLAVFPNQQPLIFNQRYLLELKETSYCDPGPLDTSTTDSFALKQQLNSSMMDSRLFACSDPCNTGGPCVLSLPATCA